MMAALPLAACASFDGMPEPVITTKQMVTLASSGEYSLERTLVREDTAARRYRTLASSEPERRRIRDAFIAVQIAAIDARYIEFRRHLAQQVKGGNLGLELGVLGVTSAGSLAGRRLANILSGTGAALTGTKAALNKEVYFERTLPALLAAMDSQRVRAKTILVDKMRTKTADQYGVAEAIADLSAYEGSASLDAAIEQVTASASTEKTDAERKYDDVVDTCVAEPGVGVEWASVRAKVRGLHPVTDKPKLDRIGELVRAEPAATPADQKLAIMRAVVRNYCTVASVADLKQTMATELGVAFP